MEVGGPIAQCPQGKSTVIVRLWLLW
jgi:hypothetical protein